VEYAEFETERRRITRAWGREITDPEVLAAAVEGLREQAATIPGQAPQARALRYLDALDDLVTEARTPESETVRRAGEVLLEASRPDGTADERRTRAEEGIAEISRIADAAPSIAERDAALEMNESLAETVAALDAGAEQPEAGRGSAVDARTAGFAHDTAIASAGRMPAPNGAAVSNRPGTTSSPGNAPRTPGRTV
jgi:hypothetical protein